MGARAGRDGAGRPRPRRALRPRRPGARSTTAPRRAPRRCSSRRSARSTSSATRAVAAGLLELLSRRSGRSAGPRTPARRSTARSRCCPRRGPEPRARAHPRAAGQDRDAAGPLQRGAAVGARGAGRGRTEAGAGPRADALNAMGLSLILLGEVEEGSAPCARRSPSRPSASSARSAWSNLADALHLVGRSDEAIAAARAGARAATTGAGRGSDWMSMTLGEIQLGPRRLGGRAPAPAAVDRRHGGMTLAYVELKRAEVALADADHEQARASLDRVADARGGLARAAVHRAGRARCAASSSAAAATSPPPAPPSTTRSTRSSSAPRTWRGSRGCRRPARRSRPTPRSVRATSATPRPSARRSPAPRAS